MHRLDRRTLEIELCLRLRKAMGEQQTGLRSKLPCTRDEALRAVIASVIDLIDNPGSCVVRASSGTPQSSYDYRRYFGRDEPWPAPLEIEQHAASARRADPQD